MSTKVSHNAREQRRARRINDKIIQLKGFLEYQGRGFRPDKYSILDAACVQLQFMYELLVEVGPSLGWADPVEELRRRMKAAPVTSNEADDSDVEPVVTAPKKARTSGSAKATTAAVATAAEGAIKAESPEAAPSSADVAVGEGSRDSKRTRAQLRPYSTYSVLEPAYFQHLMFNADLPCAVIDAGAFHTFASPMYCDLFNLTSLSGPVGVNLTSLVTHVESERLQTVVSDLFSRFSESKLRRGPREAVTVSVAFIINGSETTRDVVFSCVPGNTRFPDFVLLEVLPTSNAPPVKLPQPKRAPRTASVPKLPPPSAKPSVEAIGVAEPAAASRGKEHVHAHKPAPAPHPNPVTAMKREVHHHTPTPTPSPVPSYMSGGTLQGYPGYMAGYRTAVDGSMYSPYAMPHPSSSAMPSPASMYPGATPMSFGPQLFSGMPLEMVPQQGQLQQGPAQMYGGSFPMPSSMMPPQYYMGYAGSSRHTGLPFADYASESGGGPSTH